MKSKKIFETTLPLYVNPISSSINLYHPSIYHDFEKKLEISIMDRFLIEMTDKPILVFEKSNCLVVRNMRKGKKRDIKRFVDNKKTIV
ncbi:hypothetical protein Bfae18676_01540 [Butyricimonas faecihominis]|nr:hypothetical protein Bfae18676_01540 [Butyricimonas faecihominis]